MKIGQWSVVFLILIFLLFAAPQLQIPVSGAVSPGDASRLTQNRPTEPETHLEPGTPKPKTHNRLSEDLQHAIARVQPLLDHYGYLAVFLAVLVEGFGLLAPGQTLLMAAAFTAARGGLNILLVLLLSFAAAVLGNSLGYLIGVKGGRPLLHKLRVKEERLQRLEGYFSRYGQGIIIVARFIDGLRQLSGIVAGLLHMSWKTFTICNILGAALWIGVWGLGSYMLEKEIAKIHLPLRQVEPWFTILVLLGVLVFFIYLLWPFGKTKS